MFIYRKHFLIYIKHVLVFIKGGYKARYEPAVFQQNQYALHVNFVKGFVVTISNSFHFTIYFVIFFSY